VIFIVANKMNKDAKGVFESVKINVIDFFSSQIEFQSAQHTLASIETNLGKATNFKSIKNYSDLETSLNDYWANLDIANTFNIIKTKFETLVSNQDYVGILKVFNNKGLIPNSKVASLCDLKSSNNAYLNFILAILKEKSKSSEIIQEAITRNVRMD